MIARQTLAFIAIGMVALVLGSIAVDSAFLRPATEKRDQIADQLASMADMDQRQAQAEADLAALPAVDVGAMSSQFVLEGKSPSASSLRLLEIVRDAIALAGGQQVSSEANIEELKGGMARIEVLVHGLFDEQSMLAFIQTLEAGSPPIVIASYQIEMLPDNSTGYPLDFSARLVGYHANAR